LIDPRLRAVEEDLRRFAAVAGQLNPQNLDIERFLEILDQVSVLAEELRVDGLELIAGDFERMQEVLPQRLESLPTEAQRAELRTNLQRDRRLYDNSSTRFTAALREIEQLRQLASTIQPTPEQGRELVGRLATLREDLYRLSQSLSVIQAGLRVELITLQEFDLSIEEVVALALQNRLDLMNQRASVTDARRKVVVAANQLQGVVDVVVNGDINTPVGHKPFNFSGMLSNFQTGLRFAAPLDQIDERNVYRTTLIQYQRARRAYMLFEDQVKFAVRQEWRQLMVNQQNFEIARRAVRIAALQLDLAVEESAAPVQPGQVQSGGSQGLNLLQAVGRILDAQNNLIGIYVTYEENRLNIHRDMGIMEIDAEGVWTDPLYQRLANPTESKDDSASPPAKSHPASGPLTRVEQNHHGDSNSRNSDAEDPSFSGSGLSGDAAPQTEASAPARGGTGAAADRRLHFARSSLGLDLRPPAADGAGRGHGAGWTVSHHRDRAGASGQPAQLDVVE
jgi:hypothetical protein